MSFNLHRRAVIIASAVALLLAGGLSPTHAAPPGENTQDENGARTFYGQPEADLYQVDKELRSIVSKYPAEVLGTAFTSDRTMIEVHTTDISGAAAQEISRILTEEDLQYVRFISSKFSFDDYQGAADAILATTEGNDGFVGVALSVSGQEIVVGVEVDTSTRSPSVSDGTPIDPADPQLRSTQQTVIDEVKASIDLPVAYEAMGVPVANDQRRRAGPPIPGGAQQNSVSHPTIQCSTALPVRLNGESMMLTAGHCQGGSFTSGAGGDTIGSSHTTSFSWEAAGNMAKYGDFRLLRGGSYAKQAFHGGTTTSTRNPIGAADFLVPSEGSQYEASGRTTGTTGVYTVMRPTAIMSMSFTGLDGSERSKQVRVTEMKSIGFPNAEYLCDGWSGGDSGGLVYWSSPMGPAPYRAQGIITGSRVPADNNNCTYYYSALAYLLDWNSSITF